MIDRTYMQVGGDLRSVRVEVGKHVVWCYLFAICAHQLLLEFINAINYILFTLLKFIYTICYIKIKRITFIILK